MLATMRISYTAPHDLEISGAAHELHAIAVALERAGTDWHDLTIRADCSGDAMPYRELLSQVEFQVGYGPVQIGILGQVLRISSSANWLHVLSSYFQNASESLNHAHFEYYDGAEHVAQNSVPLVVAVRDIGASFLYPPAGVDEILVTQFVISELANIPEERRFALERIIVSPFERILSWEYGGSAQFLMVCVVAWERERNIQFVYSSPVFGAGDQWGVINSHSNSAGRDDSWFHTLDDAFIVSGLWRGPRPLNYEVS